MKKRLTRVAPLKAGIVLGILYLIFGLIFLPVMIVAALIGAWGLGGIIGVFAGIAVALGHGLVGFIFGVLGAILYNVVVKFTGGFEIEMADEGSSSNSSFAVS